MSLVRDRLLPLTLLLCGAFASAQPRVVACAAFGEDGSAATGTVIAGQLKVRLLPPSGPVSSFQGDVGDATRCEQRFSLDGHWLATVLAAKDLTVVLADARTGAAQIRFHTPWSSARGTGPEQYSARQSLAGFLPDGSLALWRYITTRSYAGDRVIFNTGVHLQRWSAAGGLLSDEIVGTSPDLGGQWPLATNDLATVWLPGICGRQCYSRVRGPALPAGTPGQVTFPGNASAPLALASGSAFFAVIGNRASHQAALFDTSGKITAEKNLPFFPNLLGPLVPDWFSFTLRPSSDEAVVAVERSRTAWVLIDTDRDWGTELLLVQLHPLQLMATLRTGSGGIRALAVDHRNGVTRVLSFWKGKWHDHRLSGSSSKLEETSTWDD